jgi:microcystin-dependent protein
MAQPYVGEIRMFAGTFNPVGWEFCEGQLLPIPENETLFNLIGTTYGGDGQSTFGLPDLRGRIPIHQGKGFDLAEVGGVESVTLTTDQMPLHNHPFLASLNPPTQSNPAGQITASNTPQNIYKTLIPPPPQVNMASQMIGVTGGNEAHNNLQPYLCINFIISLFGIYPSPS